ncbi:MAG: acetylxylan esterase [Victivallales bacterium]
MKNISELRMSAFFFMLPLLMAWMPDRAFSQAAWDMEALSQPPQTYSADGFVEDGVKAIFYEGLPFQGRPTRVFAWYGIPKVKTGQKAPGMVLVHGGSGTAYVDWVRLWTARGYAAVAMDLCGCVPKGVYPKWQRHEWAGPQGWGGFDQMDRPQSDQWCYHAVADILLANSLLRSMPEVDPERIGITGISWGGYLTCIAAAVDSRFKFAVPVYGCGFYLETAFARDVERLDKAEAQRWMDWWDPSSYLSQVKMPMLWVDGSNDAFYPLNALQKSYRLPSGPRTLAVRLRMPHGHGGPGEKPKEIYAFAESFLNHGTPLAQIKKQGRDGNRVWAEFESLSPITKAELNFTKDEAPWNNREWNSTSAEMDVAKGQVSAVLPEGTKVYFFNLTDERGLMVSTEHVELASTPQSQDPGSVRNSGQARQ